MPEKSADLTDIKTLRAQAREDLDAGAVTRGYRADRKKLIKLLNEALATEIICVLRYRHHFFMASGINAQSVAAEFKEHADQELEHADRIAERITQLGGVPDFAPDTLTARAHAEYVPATRLVDMIRENLVAERIAVQSYSELIRWVGNDDPTTRRLLEEILEQEEEHADDMSTFLENVGEKGEPAPPQQH